MTLEQRPKAAIAWLAGARGQGASSLRDALSLGERHESTKSLDDHLISPSRWVRSLHLLPSQHGGHDYLRGFGQSI
jgi:hypothetical protein